MGSRSAKVGMLLVAPLVVVFFVVIVLAIRMASEPPVSTGSHASHVGSPVTLPAFHPLRVTPPATAIERAVNQGFAQSWIGESAAQAASLPGAATCVTFPPIDSPDSQDPSAYALAFTQELLDLDFSTTTREELLAWASYNNAPNSLATMPAALDLKVLAASLTTNPTPIPSTSQWRQFAAAQTEWRVGGLVASVSPIWTQLLSTGWRPVDPLMAMYDVSGTLTIFTPDQPKNVESFFFILTLGGASWHPGYGAVVMNNWTLN